MNQNQLDQFLILLFHFFMYNIKKRKLKNLLYLMIQLMNILVKLNLRKLMYKRMLKLVLLVQNLLKLKKINQIELKH